MKKLRLGIIGLGGMGQAHCKTCRQLEDIDLAAVCDMDEASTRKVAGEYGVKPYFDYREIIDSGEVDAVIIATPHYFHPPFAVYAMKKGLHVLSEKPIAVTVDKADEMVRAARKSGRVFSVMFQMRTLPHMAAAKKLIDDGRVGRIYRTQMECAWFRTQAYYNSAGWRATWKTEGGGVLINQAPHMLDMLCWLGGMPDRVDATLLTRRHKIEVEDEAHAILKYPNGAVGYLLTSVNEVPTGDRILIAGEKGKIIIEGSALRFASVKQPIQDFCDSSPEMWAAPESTWENIEAEKKESGHKEIIRNFAASILYGEKLLSPGEEGLNSLELANAVLFSGKLKKEVKLPLDRKAFAAFFARLVAGSKERKVAGTKRETDTKIK